MLPTYSRCLCHGGQAALELELNNKPSEAGPSQPVVLFFFPPSPSFFWGGESFWFFVFFFFALGLSALRLAVSGSVDAGQCSLVAACARREKEEKVDDEFSVSAARLGAAQPSRHGSLDPRGQKRSAGPPAARPLDPGGRRTHPGDAHFDGRGGG